MIDPLGLAAYFLLFLCCKPFFLFVEKNTIANYNEAMKFTITGETPSKKNSRINTRSGRSFPNQRYVKWHDDAIRQIRAQRIKPVRGLLMLTLYFYHGDFVRRDSDNQTSSILDTLIDAGIIEDDNWKIIPVKHIYDRFDKGKPRCEIELEEIKVDL